MDDLFDFSKPLKRVVVSGGYVNGRVKVDESMVQKTRKRRPEIGDEYANDYKLEEEEKLLNKSIKLEIKRKHMDDLDTDMDEDCGGSGSFTKKEVLHIYKKYNFAHISSNNLPIMGSQFEILNTLDKSPIMVLQGATGCGKTTQVPQFILDDARSRNKHCNIIVTQPRRIAAMSIARRVCNERKWQLGTLIGYQVGLDTFSSEDTRLLYCTTGVLLEKLINTKNLSEYTHIILDEIHERDSDMDFLLIVIRKLWSFNVKLILMSATIDAVQFSEYFKFPVNQVFENAPIVNVDRKSLHVVNEFYLCNLGALKVSTDIVNYADPGISDDLYKLALKLIIIFERFDNEDDEFSTLCHRPSVLVFLPGIYEIETMYKTIEKWQSDESDSKLAIYPLHSSITTEEQSKVFLPPPKGFRKVILATNIAESSITVPDIKYVIDFCLAKNLVTDSETNFASLRMEWASKNNCRQRSGRAGRVMKGRVYRLVTKKFFDDHMQESSTPEMLRCPLENVVLKSKILDMGPPHAILAMAMTPPKLTDITNTILVLKEVGAMVRCDENDYFNTHDGDITFMGKVMAHLPLDIRVAKLIVLGYVYNVLDDAIIMAAGLTVRNMFATPFNEVMAAYSQKLSWSNGSASDLFTILNAYKVYLNKKNQDLFDNDETEALWAKRYFIQIRAMRELFSQIDEIKRRLKRFRIEEIKCNAKVQWTEREKPIILKIVICGAFYPHYFHVLPIDERDAFHVLGGRDPYNTVYYKGFDPKLVGILYESKIKEFLRPIAKPCNLKVNFDLNSQRVYVSFINSDKYLDTGSSNNNYSIQSVPGRVLTEVYKAVKLRMVKNQCQLSVMNAADAEMYAKSHDHGEIRKGIWYPVKKTRPVYNAVIPPLHVKEMVGIVPHIEHCNKFWFQPSITMETLRLIHKQLQPEVLIPFVNPSDLNVGELVAAPFNNDDPNTFSYFRARILGFHGAVKDAMYFNVFYIDYGNTGLVKFSELRKLDRFISNLKEIPPCVFMCTLVGIQPSCIDSPREIWTKPAVQELINFTKGSPVTAEIYSYVNNVAALYLRKQNSCINEKLIEKGYGQYVEENYMSQANHELRQRRQRTYDQALDSNLEDDVHNEEVEDDDEKDIEPPPERLCNQRVTLTGPINPLETTIAPLMQFSRLHRASIENGSVNSILLQTNPQDCHNKLVVATSISAKKSSQSLIARQTTVMPNIKGFDAMMAMIFAPTIEINLDKNKTRYTSVLCGLGYDPKTKEAHFDEHDMVVNMDTEITIEDLEMINQLRYSMESLLYTEEDEDLPEVRDATKTLTFEKIKEVLIELLQRERKTVEVVTNIDDYNWGKFKASELATIQNLFGNRNIFPPHTTAIVEEMKEKDLEKLRSNCQELHKLARVDTPLHIPIECKLCHKTLESVSEIRIHLGTKLHLDRESQIKFKLL